MNVWRGKFLEKIDKSYPHCGLQSMLLVEHAFFIWPVAQQVWRYVANVFGNPLPKEVTLALKIFFNEAIPSLSTSLQDIETI